MGWVFLMVSSKQKTVVDEVFIPFRGMGQVLLPAIESTAMDAYVATKCIDRKFPGKFQDYLAFLLTYRMTEPSPFTS